jgi:DNA invertase Pin-like site-specific DNA recombinase
MLNYVPVMWWPSGRLMFQLIDAVAEFERALIQERKEYGLEGT